MSNGLKHPTPTEIRDARVAAGLTQMEAGALIDVALRTWQQWEAGDRHMRAAFWLAWTAKLNARKVVHRVQR